MSRLPDGEGATHAPHEAQSSTLVDLLAAAEVFRSLSPSDLDDLLPYLEMVHLGAGETVVRQGEPADSLYVIGSGRLEIVVASDGGERVIAEVGPGGLLGEAALLTGGLRTATARCARDSLLVRLSGSHFRSYVRERPDVLLALTGELVRRAARALDGAPRSSRVRTVAVVPAGSCAVPVGEFARDLTVGLQAFGPALRRSSEVVDSLLGAGASATRLDDPRNGELVRWMQAAEEEHSFVVFEAHERPSPWTERCLRQADRILLVGRVGTEPGPSEVEEMLLGPAAAAGRATRELVLLRAASEPPRRTLAWIERRHVRAHHHVRIGHSGDRDRLARFLAGEAIGVVLSGGGARGAVHLGVLRALEEAGVPIDAVGGSSIGAIMGATYAMGWDSAKRMQVIRDGYGAGWVREATLPLVSLLRGRRLSETLQGAFGDIQIEDLPTEFVCVSTNLSRGEVELHRRGTVWRAIRASSSIPGVFSPVFAGGDLLVDGGVLSHLPVRPVRDRVGEGRIVAVDLRKDVDLHVEHDFGTFLSGWEVLQQRLHPRRRQRARIPSIGALLVRVSELGSALEERMSEASAIDVRLRPPTVGYGLMDFSTATADALFDAGYRYTNAELDRTGIGDVLARPRQGRSAGG
jgi:predicted acylesterase/phospholipase RssA/CRP-like cAMP-binding protein